MAAQPDHALRVSLEIVPKRTFAVAIDWPGWIRAGRDEDAAIETLLRAGPRYAAALTAVGVACDATLDPTELVVEARLPGTKGTEFGAPSVRLAIDSDPLDGAELERHAGIMRAAWGALDAAAVRHADDELRKGPRGGGRDLARIMEHARGADEAYLVQLGSRPPKGDGGPAPVEALREVSLATLRARATGRPVANPSKASKPWSPRWYVRYAAWHSFDHAWEIEDRAITDGAVAAGG